MVKTRKLLWLESNRGIMSEDLTKKILDMQWYSSRDVNFKGRILRRLWSGICRGNVSNDGILETHVVVVFYGGNG